MIALLFDLPSIIRSQIDVYNLFIRKNQVLPFCSECYEVKQDFSKMTSCIGHKPYERTDFNIQMADAGL